MESGFYYSSRINHGEEIFGHKTGKREHDSQERKNQGKLKNLLEFVGLESLLGMPQQFKKHPILHGNPPEVFVYPTLA